MKKILFYLSILFSLFFFVTCITTYVVYSGESFSTSPTEHYTPTSDYPWPLPGYHTISSPFGFRISPVTGASSFHSGIDIPAPEGSAIYAVTPGNVIYLDFNGANGYTIITQTNHVVCIYSHISPHFLIHLGDTISQNQLIATVGPKNIPAIPNNPYTDSAR